MKVSQLKQIIRECIEEVMIEEARSHGGQSIKKGKTQGFRKNTLYGAGDRLKRRMDITEPYGPKDRQRFNKAAIKIDASTKGERPYYIDSKGREKWAKPKSSYKKSGVGRTNEARSHGGQTVKKGKAEGFRKNTVYAGTDRLTLPKFGNLKAKLYRDREDKKGGPYYDLAAPYYIDDKGRERNLRTRKQGKGGFKAVDKLAKKTNEAYLDEKAPHRAMIKVPGNDGYHMRANTLDRTTKDMRYGTSGDKTEKYDVVKSGPRKGKLVGSEINRKKDNIKHRHDPSVWGKERMTPQGRVVKYSPKSSYKESGVGKDKPKQVKNPNTARGPLAHALRKQGQLKEAKKVSHVWRDDYHFIPPTHREVNPEDHGYEYTGPRGGLKYLGVGGTKSKKNIQKYLDSKERHMAEMGYTKRGK